MLPVLLPDGLNGASPDGNDLVAKQPSLPEWLLPKDVSPEQYEANPFSPKLYRFRKEKYVRETQQKLQQLIRTEQLMGMPQHIRSKYEQGSKIAKKIQLQSAALEWSAGKVVFQVKTGGRSAKNLQRLAGPRIRLNSDLPQVGPYQVTVPWFTDS